MIILDYYIFSIKSFFDKKGGYNKKWNRERTIDLTALMMFLFVTVIVFLFSEIYSFTDIWREFGKKHRNFHKIIQILFLLIQYLLYRHLIIKRLTNIDLLEVKFKNLSKTKKYLYNALVILTIPFSIGIIILLLII
ncbi:MAG: hypothetical protein Q8K36_02075 [Alphaproteobacteria bacterium]|nr:hypothetical protein [Alphaproteobacteria bacterium]